MSCLWFPVIFLRIILSSEFNFTFSIGFIFVIGGSIFHPVSPFINLLIISCDKCWQRCQKRCKRPVFQECASKIQVKTIYNSITQRMSGCYRNLFTQRLKQNLNHRGGACGSDMTQSTLLKGGWGVGGGIGTGSFRPSFTHSLIQ